MQKENMSKPHKSLRPGVNVTLIALWGILAAVFFNLCVPHPILIMCIAAFLGLIGGILQTLGFRQNRQAFLQATSMIEVRATLKNTAWGKRYIYFLWSGNILLIALAILLSPNSALAILAGYFTLMFVREITTLKPTLELNRIYKK